MSYSFLHLQFRDAHWKTCILLIMLYFGLQNIWKRYICQLNFFYDVRNCLYLNLIVHIFFFFFSFISGWRSRGFGLTEIRLHESGSNLTPFLSGIAFNLPNTNITLNALILNSSCRSRGRQEEWWWSLRQSCLTQRWSRRRPAVRWWRRRGRPCRSGWHWSQSPWRSWRSAASETSFLLSMFPPRLKKYNKLMVKN